MTSQFSLLPLQTVLPSLLWLILAGFACSGIYGVYRDFHTYTTGPEPADQSASVHPVTTTGPTLDMRALAQLDLMGSAEATPAAPAAPQPIPETHLKLLLRGAFTSTEPAQASALIAEKGKPSQRYFVNDALPGGAILSQVNPNFVTLSRNGRLEALYFPSVQPEQSADFHQDAPEPELAHSQRQPDDHNNTTALSANAPTSISSRSETPESIKQRLERLRAIRNTAQ